MSNNSFADGKNHLPGFFLIIALYVIVISILAIFTTTQATEYGIKKDDIQIVSVSHLVKSIDWLNDYNEERIGENILQAQIDNLNITLNNINNKSNSSAVGHNLIKYKSNIDILHGDKTIDGSLSNLKYKAQIENSKYEQALVDISAISKLIGMYEFVTILLIIGAGLGGISEIAKNKLIGYPAFAVGGIGIIILLLVLFLPSIIIGSQISHR